MKNLFAFLPFFLCQIVFAQVQSPSDFLPFALGEDFIPHHLVIDYFEHVAAESDLVQVEQYGMTNQHRPLVLTYVSTKENLQNLEQIRQNNLIRTGLLEGTIQEEEPIAIVWLGFGVHGNEAGATNSAVATLYELANPQNSKTKEWLENTVVIIDPAINPDGYSRYVNWHTQVNNHIPNPHITSEEHQEPWPGGRVNHYLFDLNRDWAWATQTETQQRLKQYKKWMPHINTDVHEQGHNDPYYFAPAAQPYHAYITKWQSDFQTEIGLNHAKYFDKEGWLYFTREVFDLFYPSYGDTYPTFNGAIGMTYEQAGHGRAGRAILTDNGDTLRLIDRILHHQTTALSTVEISSKNADRLVQNFEKYFKDANEGKIGKYTSYIIKASNGYSKINALRKLLDIHQIAYGFPKNASRITTAFSYQTGKKTTINIEKNDLVINTAQPMSVLAQVLFEPSSELVDSLTYDITAWSLPYAHGLEAYATTQAIDLASSYSEVPPTAPFVVSESPYAYLASWKSLDDVRFLADLQQEGIMVRRATEAFEIDEVRHAPGTLLILKIDNEKRIGFAYNEIVQSTALKYNIPLHIAQTGYVTKGRDFGSSSVKMIHAPKVLLLSGEEVSPYGFGQAWYYFEQEINLPITVAQADRMGAINLDDYSLLVMPDGNYNSLDGRQLEKVEKWLRNGGRLIVIGSAIRVLHGKSSFGIQPKSAEHPSTPITQVGCYAEQERRAISNQIPGAIYKTTMDNSHPLAFGMGDAYFSLKTSSTAYDYLDKGWNVGFVDTDPMVVGFVGSNVKPHLTNSLSFGVQDIGRGQVIYMVDNPLFRAFWKQGSFLFSNAVFMVQ